MKKGFLPVALIVVGIVLGPPPVSAEWFADLYLGGSFTGDEDFTITVNGSSAAGETQFKNSLLVGGRIGYWFDYRAGLALDISWFQPDADDPVLPAEITAIPISLLLMYRVPLLVSSDFPVGQLQPYIGFGPALFISSIEADLNPIGIPATASDTSVDIGFDVRAGVAYLLRQNLGVFTEYRFTSVEAKVEDNILGANVTIESTFNTHHVAIGVSYRF